MKKRKALAGVVALTLLIGGISVFANQPSEEKKASPRQRIELTEEQKAQMKAKMQEKAKDSLAEQLEEGTITKEQYDEKLSQIESGEFEFARHKKGRGKGFGHCKELTEEQKATMQEKAKEALAKQLEEGKITKEQYDEKLSQIESGEFEFPPHKKGRGSGFGRTNRHIEVSQTQEVLQAE